MTLRHRFFGVLGVLLLAARADAAWLVLRDGQVVEVRSVRIEARPFGF